jgi:predicted kinase
MKRLFIMCGTAFSGKTTLAKQLVQDLGCTYISLDDINAKRGLHSGEGVPTEEWQHTHNIARERLRRMMARGEDIVLDDTSCLRWLRKSHSALARPNGCSSELVYLDVSLNEVAGRIARNSITASRPAIESEVIDTHVRIFNHPKPMNSQPS